jgi:hypothetical protein
VQRFPKYDEEMPGPPVLNHLPPQSKQTDALLNALVDEALLVPLAAICQPSHSTEKVTHDMFPPLHESTAIFLYLLLL